ncbi:TonB-dependent receptor [Aridibaculum aurantiacum]|uniref:TonB-dependent receptor n=1 Tax=Aridibaculum aurantiacum TaxID=2810307 RepID=UPI001A96BA79|nr:TonB-dependent receptor [Aridibaculum aurantiacum]
MKRLLILFWFILLSAGVNAQVEISGWVKDAKGKGIAGASISIKDSYDGATSDSTGNYRFTTSEKGAVQLVITCIGYKELEQQLEIGTDNLALETTLKEKLDELKAVMVTAGSFEAGDRKRAATVLNSIDVATVGGANADITAAVKTLPGAQQVGEQEGLFVRGGAGYETKQIIDGTVVNNPFFTSVPDIASRGRFSPFLFKGNVFSTGGYSALYGQALSSVLILESIDMPEQSQASASLSTVFLGAGFQQLAKNKKSSWGVNYGYTNLQPYFEVVKQKPDYFAVPEFHSGDANFRIKTKGGIIKYYTTFSTNKLGLRRPNIDSTILKDAFALENLNWYNNLSWRENLGNGWKLNSGFSYSTNVDKLDQQVQDQMNKPLSTGIGFIDAKTFELQNRNDLAQARAVLEKRLIGISTIRFGGEYWYGFQKSKYNGYNTMLQDHFTAAFAETDIHFTNNLAAKAGVRYEYSSIISRSNFAPRLSLAYKTGKDAQMSFAYGTFYQKPENMQLMTTTDLGYTKAVHYLANYIKSTNTQTFRVEAFYKDYQDLVKTAPTYNNNGKGFAKGIELFWRDKKTVKNLDYWISYSYLDTKRDFLNYPTQLQPTFATPHTANLVTKRFVTQWKTGFNFTYTYATGRPYYNFQLNRAEGKYAIADRGETKDYHNLGFSLNYLPNLGKKDAKTFMVLVASVTNVLNQDQVFGYNYSYNGMRKEAITPPAKQFFFVGLFLSWGVDRTQDAINGNL